MRQFKWLAAAFMLAASLLHIVIPQAMAQDARSLCESLDRPNVDCACVTKRYEAYLAWAQTPAQKAIVRQAYPFSYGLENEYEAAFEAAMTSQEASLRLQLHFDPVGGIPSGAGTFDKGCGIPGAPQVSLPAVPADPGAQKLYKACVDYPSDPRYCQCDVAMTASIMSQRELAAYYYSFNEQDKSGPGDLESQDNYAAAKLGTSVDAYLTASRAARAKLKKVGDRNLNYCSSLRYGEENEGRSAAARAGTPVGFEDAVKSPSLEQLQADIKRDQDAARAEAETLAMTDAQKAAMVAEAEAKTQQFNRQLEADKAKGTQLAEATSPRALFDQNCPGAGNEPQTCQCLSKIFDDSVRSSGASDSVATQLAILMTGGGMDDGDVIAMMRSANPADMAAASQIFGANVMKVMTCP